MNSKTTLPISEARKKIFEIAEAVQKPGVYYTLTEKGRPKVVIMSVHEFESLMEDLEILSDPKTMERIQKAEEEIDRGEFISLDQLKKEMNYEAKKSLMVMEKISSKNLYKTKRKGK